MKIRKIVKYAAIASIQTPLAHPIEYALDGQSKIELTRYRWGCFTVIIFQLTWIGYGLWMAIKGDIGSGVLCASMAILFQKAKPPFPHPLKMKGR